MRLPGRTDYALRAVLELAASPDGPVTTEELSHRQDIPHSYLGAILAELRKADVVHARRGAEGGWTLARPAADISLADVIRAVDGALTNVAGTRPEDLHYSGAAAGLPQVLVALRAAERQILEAVSLADVVEGHLSDRVRTLTEDPAAWH
jgi:Rrf2 family protein